MVINNVQKKYYRGEMELLAFLIAFSVFNKDGDKQRPKKYYRGMELLSFLVMFGVFNKDCDKASPQRKSVLKKIFYRGMELTFLVVLRTIT
uniref:Uncharacterized protein n=1 Tax=Rhodnius prolixus TaxID=13249 RepID=T1IEH1_RHOPR